MVTFDAAVLSIAFVTLLLTLIMAVIMVMQIKK